MMTYLLHLVMYMLNYVPIAFWLTRNLQSRSHLCIAVSLMIPSWSVSFVDLQAASGVNVTSFSARNLCLLRPSVTGGDEQIEGTMHHSATDYVT